jgi:ParB family transcriptional regulator, chromosome partitioning protein
MSAKSTPVPRLGRGLSSLIKLAESPIQHEIQSAISPVQNGTATIPIQKIQPNPHQPRRQFNETTLTELAASIKSAGLIQPIIVRPTVDGYELIAGERRLRAAQLAGMQDIPAIVRQVDSFAQAQLALIENIQREDLNPLDRATAYQALIDQLGLTQNELANRLGEERSSIANFLRLLSLAEPVRELLRSSQLSFGHAKLLAGIADPIEQLRLAQLVTQRDLSVRNLEQILRTNVTPPAPARPSIATSPAHVADLEKSMTSQLGLRVQLRPSTKSGQGRLIIHYANLDQFDELLKHLNVVPAND